MMNPHLATVQALLLVLVFIHISPSHCILVKGSVSCLDCASHQDLSGVRVAVKCRNEKKLIYTVTNSKGQFEDNIPTMNSSSSSSLSSSLDCLAMLLGGPTQLCAPKQSMTSALKRAGDDSYGWSTPLAFFTKCPSKITQGNKNKSEEKRPAVFSQPLDSTNIPLIILFPFIPIIGIP